MKLTFGQNAILARAIEAVSGRDPDEVLREHLEEIAAGRFVSPLTTAQEAQDILATHPRPQSA